jgi:hypothetical protein
MQIWAPAWTDLEVKYFRELLENNTEVDKSIRPLLKLSRERIVRLQKTEDAVVSALERDPQLCETAEFHEGPRAGSD